MGARGRVIGGGNEGDMFDESSRFPFFSIPFLFVCVFLLIDGP